MALGELLCEYKDKITSMKVLPFKGNGQGVKSEVTQVAGVHIKFLAIRQRAAFENPSMPATTVRERRSARRGGH